MAFVDIMKQEGTTSEIIYQNLLTHQKKGFSEKYFHENLIEFYTNSACE